jgi:hypothetical protein
MRAVRTTLLAGAAAALAFGAALVPAPAAAHGYYRYGPPVAEYRAPPRPYYYRPAPRVYYPPPPVYYAPPPPMYYAPPPPRYYGPPGVTFGFTFR